MEFGENILSPEEIELLRQYRHLLPTDQKAAAYVIATMARRSGRSGDIENGSSAGEQE